MLGRMEAETSRNVCALIAGMIFVDGELHPNEQKLYDRVRAQFGVGDDVSIAPVTDHDEAIATLRALPEADRDTTLSLLIEAAVADGMLHPAERILIGSLAAELGIDEAAIDERLTAALDFASFGATSGA